MGIKGLLPQLKSIKERRHLSEYRGQRVAIDAYIWLHRAALTCARELVERQRTDRYAGSSCLSSFSSMTCYSVPHPRVWALEEGIFSPSPATSTTAWTL